MNARMGRPTDLMADVSAQKPVYKRMDHTCNVSVKIPYVFIEI